MSNMRKNSPNRDQNNTRKSVRKSNNKRSATRTLRSGTANKPPVGDGGDQVSTIYRIRDRTETRVVRADLELTSSAAGQLVLGLCTNLLFYNMAVGAATVVGSTDVGFLSSFSLAKIKGIELIWMPIIPVSTAVANLFACYEPSLASASFNSLSLATLLNYNNLYEIETRKPTRFDYTIMPNDSSVGLPAVANNGWIPASQFANLSLSAYTAPGTIAIQGSSLGVSQLLGRLTVSYLVGMKGRI